MQIAISAILPRIESRFEDAIRKPRFINRINYKARSIPPVEPTYIPDDDPASWPELPSRTTIPSQRSQTASDTSPTTPPPTTKPSYLSVLISVQPTAIPPVEPDTTTPVPDTTTPVPDTTTPVPDTTTPAPDTTTPVPDTTTPAPDTTTPVPDTTTPVPDTTTPAPDTTTPVPDTTTPVPDTTTPAPDTTTPVPDTTTPAPDTTTPVPDTTTPAPDTTTQAPPPTKLSRRQRKNRRRKSKTTTTQSASDTTTPASDATTPVPDTTTPASDATPTTPELDTTQTASDTRLQDSFAGIQIGGGGEGGTLSYRSVVYSSGLKTFLESDVIFSILSNPDKDKDKLSDVTTLKPKGGETFLITDNGDVCRTDDWSCDGYFWVNKGGHGIPKANPKMWKRTYYISEGKGDTKGSKNFQRRMYMMKKGTVTYRFIQYIGDETIFVPRVHGNGTDGNDYRRTFPSVLKQVKSVSSSDSNPSSVFKRNQTEQQVKGSLQGRANLRSPSQVRYQLRLARNEKRLSHDELYSTLELMYHLDGYIHDFAIGPDLSGLAMSLIRPYKGSRVIRGPDWAYGNQDGGIGHIGTVVESDPESQMCSVLWDYGMLMENCRAGDNGIDLRVIDTETSDFEYNLHTAYCDTCVKVGPAEIRKSISGFRWKCVECKDFDLCNLCYMLGKHDVNHRFMRYDNKLATVFPVPPRKRCKKLKVYSLMPDAQVKRSRRKGIDSDIGVIKKITKNDSTKNQETLVEWKSGETTTHLSGPKCKFDLVAAHHTVSIYLDHLPLADFNKIPDSWINVGDTIQIDLNIDTFKSLQKEYGGWNESMEKIMGELGTVKSVETQKFHVYYTVSERTWFVCSNACAKVSIAEAGDKVKVLENQAVVKERQNRHGGWRENMKDILGKTGEVERVDSSGDLTVAFTSGIHLLNPSCCVKVMNPSQLPPKTTDTELRMTAEVEERPSDKPKMKTETQTGEMEEKREKNISDDAKKESALRTVTEKTSIPVDEQQDIDSKDRESLQEEEDDDEDDDGIDFLQWLTQTDYEDMMEPGIRVVRGKDWKWGEQDGGEGNVGTVIDVSSLDEGGCPLQCAIIQWDSGYRNTYRAGFEDSFDLRIYDTATIGIRHPSLVCSVCEESEMMGFIWRCETNPDIILCNTCYHGDKHDVKLHFVRINKPGDTGVRVNKREMSRKVTAKGVFEGARVCRGPDWMWEDQDGNGMGKVISIVNFSLDTDRDAVEVTWDIGQTNVYRHGYDGRLDLKCTKTTHGGTYYRDQLPDFKINLATLPPHTASVGEASSDRLNAGDSVRIGVDPEVLKAIHDSTQGMWNDSMIDCIGKIGEVVVQSGEDVTVKFDIGSWTFKEMALDKVKQLKKGETVRVRDNEQEVKELQNGHGNWNSQIQKTLGKKGKVFSIDRDGDVTVAFGPLKFQFNPAVLDSADGDPDVLALSDDKPPKSNPATSVKPPSPSPATTERPCHKTKTKEQLLAELEEVVRDGYADRVRNILEENNNLRDMGTPPLIITACELGHTEVVKELINFQCKLDVRNDKDTSKSDPLLTAVRKKHRDVADVLLNAGVKKTVTNSHGQTAIHIAVQERDMQMLTLLQKHKLDINKKDNLGDSAITDAISTGDKRFIDMIVDWQGIQLNYFNRMSFSPLHFAARKGDNYAIRKILQKDPSLVNIPKNDGFTALHLAACQDHVGIVKYLVGLPSVDREAKTSKGLTPLHVAAVHESVKSINLFLGLDDGIEPVSTNQPLVDVDSMDDMGNNALHLCLRGDNSESQQSMPSEESVQRQKEIALKLIHRGVKYNARNLDEKTPLEECTNEHVKEKIRTALQEKDVRHKKQPAAPPSNLCMSCNEDQASYQLMPCQCKICTDCGGRKAKKCPNCSSEVQNRTQL
ncbi:uncharacterized protein LOC117344636 [Pecten maximus]|uniref:uncharacterized protein LOC117344636 n=1 Tax=Pecten maximus TaxID=6579 RepID=UPI001458DA0A|nr:uncharacterized protein LOC117344636 [Pecten maximus]